MQTPNLPDPAKFARALARQGRTVADAAANAIRAATPVGKGGDPRRTPGGLRDSTRGEVSSQSAEGFTADVAQGKAAEYVIGGTGAHEIRPHGRALMFYGTSGSAAASVRGKSEGSGAVFARLVHHPGTKPNDYVEQALPAIDAAVDQAVDTALAEL